MGGSSGSGGGSSSGAVSYPAYMSTWHAEALDDSGSDTFDADTSITVAINSAFGASPYSGETVYDPATAITAMDTAVTALNSAVDALDHDDDWEAALDTTHTKIDGVLVDDTTIDAEIAAFSAQQDDDRDTNILPRFQAGMLNVNAVMSSSFVIGEAVIEAFGARDVTKYGTDLRLRAYLQRNQLSIDAASDILKNNLQRVDFERVVAHYTIEANRLEILANKEEVDEQLELDAKDALWDLEIWQYGSNLLASIGGGTAGTGKQGKGSSKMGNALSGAAGGAMVGYQAGGGYGAIAGAVIGGIGGYMS